MQYLTANLNAAAAPPNTLILTAPPIGAQPTIVPLLPGQPVALPITESGHHCPTCGRWH